MIISRMQVEEGFLNGLDLKLGAGLNVLIGARGTGKTSIVELIRFALGVQANTSDAQRRSADHSRSILGSGQVTLTIEAGETSYTVTRSADDAEPRADGPLPRPIVFSQTEIEQIGVLPDGRLRILDGFISERSRYASEDARLVTDARSKTAELMSAQRELAELGERLAELPAITAALADAIAQEEALLPQSAAAAERKTQLDALSAGLAAEAVRDGYLDRQHAATEYWVNPLAELTMFSAGLESWDGQGEDPIDDLRAAYLAAERKVSHATDEFVAVRNEIDRRRSEGAARRLPLDNQARALRREIEALQEGAGQATRRTAQLKERRAQLEALQNVYRERRSRLEALQQRRGAVLDEVEKLRQRRFESRQAVAAMLNRQLRPRIRVDLVRAGDLSAYARVVVDALRGSGLKYSELAVQLTQSLSPRELLEACEMNAFEEVAEIAGIAKDRAARLVAHLRDNGLEDLAGCALEDEASFSLLDGGDFKDLESLSTGQRCTVILPMLLEHRDRILVMDQPEDHIDNAFIADTVIKALVSRSADGQIIVSTHNANIPVLGDADRVVQMASDGRVGFVKHAGALEEEPTIEAITGLMEGGREAFRRRAAVYDRF